ncbi:uncharacterized protein [Panulirus ornatus]|uniref:uncharacterized protein isoform X2 n=1 Tax=Panulirus ornatus TaxID=150431 RepID=UPI003A85DF34
MEIKGMFILQILCVLSLSIPSHSDQDGARWTSNHHNQVEVTGGQKVTGGRFVTRNNSIVTAQVGASVILHCKTSSATGGLVSWIRKRDYQLLTVGLHAHSSDDRFSVNYVHWDWQLHVRYVQPRDAGVYECQVSSHPPTSLFVHLDVVEAQAEILGAPEKHVKLGSTLRLVCIMHHTTEALSYVFWYRGADMINYESEDGAGSVVVESDDHTSVLMVTSANRHHSGNYTCAPSNTKPASILVHILNEYPAAMQHGGESSSSIGAEPPSLVTLLALLSLLLLIQLSLAPPGTPWSLLRVTAPSTDGRKKSRTSPFYGDVWEGVRHRSDASEQRPVTETTVLMAKGAAATGTTELCTTATPTAEATAATGTTELCTTAAATVTTARVTVSFQGRNASGQREPTNNLFFIYS